MSKNNKIMLQDERKEEKIRVKVDYQNRFEMQYGMKARPNLVDFVMGMTKG